MSDDFEPLGTGPTATVYSGLYLALKVYPPVDRAVLDAFRAEQAALAPLRDEAAILLVDDVVDAGDGRPALQMELCSMSLAGMVAAGGPLLPADVLTVGHAVASAVAAAHRVGVVHGGLSPHNVLFHPSGAPVVADFGVALRRAFPVVAGEYTAPETARDGTRDERSDLHGLGGVLHLALTGAPPGAEVAWPDAPPELVRLVRRLLADDPADRPSTADVVVRHLAALRDPATEPDEPETPPEPGEPPARRRRVRVRTVAGLVAAASVLVTAPNLIHDQLSDPPSAAPARPAPTTSGAAAPVTLALADPTDGGAHVDLSWEAPEGFTFAVVVAPEKQAPQVLIAHRNRAMRVPVTAGTRYCFLVQATDGARVLETGPKAIRGATCKV
ncbi:serine/threonine protein kinase [Saccharothrix sp. NPDC042600]|uniref:protein kinase domain-containing protein n=1 Tax=Saccharothrix TaxID=2071 RepID=UPI0033EC6081